MNLKECKKFSFIYKGEHFFKIDSIIILFKFKKVNMEKFGGKTGSKKWGIKNWEVRASKSSLL
ncbi:hypothetical protein DXD66_05690 [Fusobacterium varium]|nr:hypothetical protein DXD66_05690 [Fusobacterium varium]